MNRELLSKEEITSSLLGLKNWELKGNKIKKQYDFKDFIEAFSFITKVALISESLNHHPELKNIYNKVSIELTTHDANGLTEIDLKLATSIDKAFQAS